MDSQWYQQCEEFSKWVDENCPGDDSSQEEWTAFYTEARKRMPTNWAGKLLPSAEEQEDE